MVLVLTTNYYQFLSPENSLPFCQFLDGCYCTYSHTCILALLHTLTLTYLYACIFSRSSWNTCILSHLHTLTLAYSIYLHCIEILIHFRFHCGGTDFEDLESIDSNVTFQFEESVGNAGNFIVACVPDFSMARGIDDEHAYFRGIHSPCKVAGIIQRSFDILRTVPSP